MEAKKTLNQDLANIEQLERESLAGDLPESSRAKLVVTLRPVQAVLHYCYVAASCS